MAQASAEQCDPAANFRAAHERRAKLVMPVAPRRLRGGLFRENGLRDLRHGIFGTETALVAEIARSGTAIATRGFMRVASRSSAVCVTRRARQPLWKTHWPRWQTGRVRRVWNRRLPLLDKPPGRRCPTWFLPGGKLPVWKRLGGR
jgi:hypothetical protein